MDVDLYARISDDQDDDKHGTENQLKECKAYAADKGWTVVDVYRDDSISATKGKRRPGFEALLERAVRRPVLCWHTDRLMRVTDDLERVIKQDLTVYAVHVGAIDLSTETGKAIARTVTAWATHEGNLKAERQVAANKALAAKGVPMWRKSPYGHTAMGELVPHEAEVIRECAERVLRGESARSVKKWLSTVDGAPETNVSRLLTSPRLAGHNYYRGEKTAASQIDPILDEDTFSDLCTLLKDPARRTSGARGKVTTLLTSIAQCGVCNDGTTLHSSIEVKKGQRHEMYRCRKQSHNLHARFTVDNEVVTKTLDLLGSDEAPEIVERHSAPPTDLRDRLGELRDQLAAWQDTALDLGPVEYARITKPLKAELADLEERMRQQSHRSVFEDLNIPAGATLRQWLTIRKELSARWRGLPLLKQREIISALWIVILTPRPKTGPKGRYRPHPECVQMIPR